MQVETLNSLFKAHRNQALYGRHIHTEIISPLLKQLPEKFKVEVIGKSVLDEDIYSVTIGTGPNKVLMWSQMHGNESTTTKALFDLFNVLKEKSSISNRILSQCTLKVIPILNPDGAKAYTRLNSNGIDLNRDAKNLSQFESKALRSIFDNFKPSFCYNLHGQRTIFGAGNNNSPSTVSFLAPAQDIECTITPNRKKAMEVIVIMNNMLQQQIPHQVGIYDDAFNDNCVGDTFQSNNVPTILFEAGHYKDDYDREHTRTFIFNSLIVSLLHIAENIVDGKGFKAYENIPKNEKNFYDIIIRNAKVDIDGIHIDNDIAIQYQEVLESNTIRLIPRVEKIDSDLSMFYGHREIDANYQLLESINKNKISVGYENDFVKVNNERLSLKLSKT